MDIVQLKKSIEEKTISDILYIFKYTDSKFICHQYINEIARILNKEINYTDTLSFVNNDLFGMSVKNDFINVFDTDTLDIDDNYNLLSNTIIICKSVSKEIADRVSNIVVEFPRLQEWQVKDYAYSLLEGVNQENIEKLCSLCSNDIYRLSNEVDRIVIFDKSVRNNTFENFYSDNVYHDITSNNIFDLTNSILNNDKNKVNTILQVIDNIDVGDYGFLTILYQGFRNVFCIQCNNQTRHEDLEISQKQFNAIKYYNTNHFDSNKLFNILMFLNGIDKKIKTGFIDINNLIDYIVVNIFNS